MKDVSLMIDNIKFNYRVGLIIEREDEIYIEFNPNIDFTTIPGGRVKTLENSREALEREIKEETGIDIRNDKLNIKGLIENFFEFENKKYHEMYIIYKMKIAKDDKRFEENMKNIDSKANYYKWIKKEELNKVNLLPVVLQKTAKTDTFENIVVDDLKM